MNKPNLEGKLVKEPESRHLIRFSDCDPFGHLNNVRYFDYFLNAREDQLLKFYGLNFFERSKQEGTNWVVSLSQIAYLMPALIMEEVLIRTRLVKVKDRAVVMEGLMLDSSQTVLKALTWMEFTYVSLKDGRALKHPPELLDFYRTVQAFELPESCNPFEERIRVLKTELRRARMGQGGV